MNLDYWNNYYSQQDPQINQPSPFAQHILDNYQFSSIIDFGCGNGRDSIFFNKSGKKVLACDFSSASISSINNSETLITKEVDFEIVEPRLFYREFNEYEAGYARFFICAISDIGIHKFLKCARYSIKQDGLLFIECRSDKGQLSDSTHNRNLINIDRLKQLLNENLFEIKIIEESSGFSPTDKEDPVLIRCIAINKNCTKYSNSCKSVRSCCTDKLRDLLFDVVDLLEKNDIQYWIDFGTLLGAVRGQDIIKWDRDVDISVYSNNRSKIESLKEDLNNLGYNFKTNKYIAKVYPSIYNNKVWLDIYYWDKLKGGNIKNCCPGFNSKIAIFPENMIGELTKVTILDREFFAPKMYKEKLTRMYGKWEVEVKRCPYWGGK